MGEDIVPRSTVSKQLMKGIGGVGGGIVAFIVSALVGGIPALGGILAWILNIGGIGLLILGGISLYQFFKNMKKRM